MIGKTFILSLSANDVNDIINAPEVYSDVLVAGSDGGYLDTTKLFNRGAFAVLTLDKKGGAMFIPNEDGEAEGHSFARKEARGQAMLEACRDGSRFVLDELGCKRIFGYTPVNNKAAISLTKRCGYEIVREINKDRGAGIVEPLLEFEMV